MPISFSIKLSYITEPINMEKNNSPYKKTLNFIKQNLKKSERVTFFD